MILIGGLSLITGGIKFDVVGTALGDFLSKAQVAEYYSGGGGDCCSRPNDRRGCQVHVVAAMIKYLPMTQTEFPTTRLDRRYRPDASHIRYNTAS